MRLALSAACSPSSAGSRINTTHRVARAHESDKFAGASMAPCSTHEPQCSRVLAGAGRGRVAAGQSDIRVEELADCIKVAAQHASKPCRASFAGADLAGRWTDRLGDPRAETLSHLASHTRAEALTWLREASRRYVARIIAGGSRSCLEM